MSKNLLILADTDSRALWGAKAARYFETRGYATRFVLFDVPNAAKPAYLESLGVTLAGRAATIEAALSDQELAAADVLVLAVAGVDFKQAVDRIADWTAGKRRRPILVTGFWGMVLDRAMEGLLWRQGSDIICVNSRKDMTGFAGILEAVGRDPSQLVLTGFPSAQCAGPPQCGSSPVRKVVFVEQPGVPRSRRDRVYLLNRLAEYARKYPEREIFIKPRSRYGRAATHIQPYQLQKLMWQHRIRFPANVSITHRPLQDLLDEADLCLTISSTAAVEALAAGVRVALLGDFGIGESMFNHGFADSGLIVPFDDVVAGGVPDVRPSWLADNGFSGDESFDNCLAAIDALRSRQTEGGAALPVSAPYFSPDRHPRLFPTGADRGPIAGKFTAMKRLLIARLVRLWFSLA